MQLHPLWLGLVVTQWIEADLVLPPLSTSSLNAEYCDFELGSM